MRKSGIRRGRIKTEEMKGKRRIKLKRCVHLTVENRSMLPWTTSRTLIYDISALTNSIILVSLRSW